jgi:hypothetical protein
MSRRNVLLLCVIVGAFSAAAGFGLSSLLNSNRPAISVAQSPSKDVSATQPVIAPQRDVADELTAQRDQVDGGRDVPRPTVPASAPAPPRPKNFLVLEGLVEKLPKFKHPLSDPNSILERSEVEAFVNSQADGLSFVTRVKAVHLYGEDQGYQVKGYGARLEVDLPVLQGEDALILMHDQAVVSDFFWIAVKDCFRFSDIKPSQMTAYREYEGKEIKVSGFFKAKLICIERFVPKGTDLGLVFTLTDPVIELTGK